MEKNQILTTAEDMFLNGSRRKEVIQFLEANGIQGEEASQKATEAYNAIKDQRAEMIEEEYAGDESGWDAGGNNNGTTSIAIGALFLIGGIVATAMSDSIWYGAMLVGVVTIFSGVAKSMR